MSTASRTDPYELALFKATVRLSAATDACYVLARDVEDALQQLRAAYADMNVLYVTSVERLAGTVYISAGAQKVLQKALE